MSFYSELKRRNVFRVAAGYVVLSWLLLQIADVLMDTIGLPDIWGKAVLGLILIGILPVLIFSWVYEMTPEGLKRENEIPTEASITSHTAKKLDIAVIALLLIAIGVFAIDKFTRAPAAAIAPVAATEPSLNVIPVVAVLPLQALSTDDEGVFLASGLHDDLLTRLAQLKAFKVISRTSVMEYADTTMNLREIGAELGANYILEGGLQAIGGNVRINAQLIDAASDEHLWADTYDRALTTANLFEVQADIAGAIAEAMHATLSPKEIEQLSRVPTENLAAYEAYLRGNDLLEGLTMPAIHGAIAANREAIELDPDFDEAWSSLSLALIRQYWEEGAEEGAAPNENLVEESWQALERARELAPDSFSTLEAESYFHYYGFRDYSSALVALGKAAAIAPNDVRVTSLRGYLLRRIGRSHEAANSLMRSLELDPRSPSLIREAIDTLIPIRRCDDARSLLNAGLEHHPNDDGLLVAQGYVATACDRDVETAIRASLAVEVSTMSQITRTTNTLILAGAYDEAIQPLLEARDSWVQRPTVFLIIENYLTWLYRKTGRHDLADQALKNARAHAAQLTDRGISSVMQLMKLAALEGDANATRQFGEQAMAAMPDDAWRITGFSYRVARFYALAGLNDEAFSVLENIVFDHGYSWLSTMDRDTFLDGMRDDPRYEEIHANGMAQLEAARRAAQ